MKLESVLTRANCERINARMVVLTCAADVQRALVYERDYTHGKGPDVGCTYEATGVSSL